MEMRFHTHEAIVMQLSDGVMVRTRSTQRQERDVTPQESFELELMVGITGVNTSFQVRFQAKVDCQQPGEQTPTSIFITSELVRQ